MGTTQSSFEKRTRILNYVIGDRSNMENPTAKKKETIGWAMIKLGMTKRYATELVQAFIDSGKIREIESEGEVFLTPNGAG